jgi:class 3 adenylate cyclase/pimeloyl-ACP methyl ester carboxylesterase
MENMVTETRFAALANGQEVAYRSLSRSPGPVIVHCPGGMAPIEVLEEDPPYERFLRTLGGYGSLLVYDFVGKGASDPFDPELDFVDQNADCFVAVLDACEIEKAWLVVGDAQGAPLARRVATRYPDRLSGAAVLNPPGGRRRLSVDNILARDDSSNDLLLRAFMPSRADDPAFRAWHERAGRLGASAAAARALMEAGDRSTSRVRNETDVISNPPPFLLLYRRERVPPTTLEWWYDRFPGAEVVALEGADASFHALDSVMLADTIGVFVTGNRRHSFEDRPLLAVLFIDLVASTEAVGRVGDTAWTAVLDGYEQVVERISLRHGGSVVKHVGDGTLMTFPTGSRAVDAAVSIRIALSELGLDACFGIHVGEVESRGDDIGGLAVHLAARVMSEAMPGQILATSTAVQSMAGGTRRFEVAGVRDLKGIDQPWELHALIIDSARSRSEDHSRP